MLGFINMAIGRFSKQEAGFALNMLLKVIGIIVAIIVALAFIVPLLFTSDGSGKDPALKSEREAVQVAMDALMAEKGLTAVNANEGLTPGGVKDWSAQPTTGTGMTVLAIPLKDYLKKITTDFYYCWSANGTVWARNKAGERPTADSAKKAGTCNPLPKT